MFAGIVEATGVVVALGAVEPRPQGGAAARLCIRAGDLFKDLPSGASVAINGVCLTLVEHGPDGAIFDVVPETLRRTNLGGLRPGAAVNVERSLRVGDRVDGHFVQGHVDCVGKISRIDRDGGEWKLWVDSPRELLRYVVVKGSIAIDGVSLTVVDVTAGAFSVVLIPVTLARTILGRASVGYEVNLEADVLARLAVSRMDDLMSSFADKLNSGPGGAPSPGGRGAS